MKGSGKVEFHFESRLLLALKKRPRVCNEGRPHDGQRKNEEGRHRTQSGGAASNWKDGKIISLGHFSVRGHLLTSFDRVELEGAGVAWPNVPYARVEVHRPGVRLVHVRVDETDALRGFRAVSSRAGYHVADGYVLGFIHYGVVIRILDRLDFLKD